MVNRKVLAFVLGLSLVLMPQAVVAQNVDRLFERGNAAQEERRYEDAERIWRQLLEIEPDNDAAYNNLGLALDKQGKFEEALAAYRTALSLPNRAGNPTNAHSAVHNSLGYALQQQGDFEAAIIEYQKAIALDPNYSLPQSNLKEAERLLALRLNPPPPDIEEILPTPEEQPFFPLQRSVVLIISQTTRGASKGTGWVIKREDNKAWIVTNRHVISEEEGSKRPLDNIEIELYSLLPPEHRLRLPATVAYTTDPTDPLDLAVLEVANLPEDIQPLSLAPSPVALDADVRIIGHPITGSPWSMLRGYIAATIPSPEGKDIQIAGADLAIGNSGSPVLYDRQVVAVVVEISNEASAATGQNTQVSTGGFGFAYPIRTVLEQLREWGVYP
ncbi:MAG: tetratricopeptide repeat protein [Cyanobacteria bacterium P01_E01_bin.42]